MEWPALYRAVVAATEADGCESTPPNACPINLAVRLLCRLVHEPRGADAVYRTLQLRLTASPRHWPSTVRTLTLLRRLIRLRAPSARRARLLVELLVGKETSSAHAGGGLALLAARAHHPAVPVINHLVVLLTPRRLPPRVVPDTNRSAPANSTYTSTSTAKKNSGRMNHPSASTSTPFPATTPAAAEVDTTKATTTTTTTPTSSPQVPTHLRVQVDSDAFISLADGGGDEEDDDLGDLSARNHVTLPALEGGSDPSVDASADGALASSPNIVVRPRPRPRPQGPGAWRSAAGIRPWPRVRWTPTPRNVLAWRWGVSPASSPSLSPASRSTRTGRLWPRSGRVQGSGGEPLGGRKSLDVQVYTPAALSLPTPGRQLRGFRRKDFAGGESGADLVGLDGDPRAGRESDPSAVGPGPRSVLAHGASDSRTTTASASVAAPPLTTTGSSPSVPTSASATTSTLASAVDKPSISTSSLRIRAQLRDVAAAMMDDLEDDLSSSSTSASVSYASSSFSSSTLSSSNSKATASTSTASTTASSSRPRSRGARSSSVPSSRRVSDSGSDNIGDMRGRKHRKEKKKVSETQKRAATGSRRGNTARLRPHVVLRRPLPPLATPRTSQPSSAGPKRGLAVRPRRERAMFFHRAYVDQLPLTRISDAEVSLALDMLVACPPTATVDDEDTNNYHPHPRHQDYDLRDDKHDNYLDPDTVEYDDYVQLSQLAEEEAHTAIPIVVKLIMDMFLSAGPRAAAPLTLALLRRNLTHRAPCVRARAYDIVLALAVHGLFLEPRRVSTTSPLHLTRIFSAWLRTLLWAIMDRSATARESDPMVWWSALGSLCAVGAVGGRFMRAACAKCPPAALAAMVRCLDRRGVWTGRVRDAVVVLLTSLLYKRRRHGHRNQALAPAKTGWKQPNPIPSANHHRKMPPSTSSSIVRRYVLSPAALNAVGGPAFIMACMRMTSSRDAQDSLFAVLLDDALTAARVRAYAVAPMIRSWLRQWVGYGGITARIYPHLVLTVWAGGGGGGDGGDGMVRDKSNFPKSSSYPSEGEKGLFAALAASLEGIPGVLPLRPGTNTLTPLGRSGALLVPSEDDDEHLVGVTPNAPAWDHEELPGSAPAAPREAAQSNHSTAWASPIPRPFRFGLPLAGLVSRWVLVARASYGPQMSVLDGRLRESVQATLASVRGHVVAEQGHSGWVELDALVDKMMVRESTTTTMTGAAMSALRTEKGDLSSRNKTKATKADANRVGIKTNNKTSTIDDEHGAARPMEYRRLGSYSVRSRTPGVGPRPLPAAPGPSDVAAARVIWEGWAQRLLVAGIERLMSLTETETGFSVAEDGTLVDQPRVAASTWAKIADDMGQVGVIGELARRAWLSRPVSDWSREEEEREERNGIGVRKVDQSKDAFSSSPSLRATSPWQQWFGAWSIGLTPTASLVTRHLRSFARKIRTLVLLPALERLDPEVSAPLLQRLFETSYLVCLSRLPWPTETDEVAERMDEVHIADLPGTNGVDLTRPSSIWLSSTFPAAWLLDGWRWVLAAGTKEGDLAGPEATAALTRHVRLTLSVLIRTVATLPTDLSSTSKAFVSSTSSHPQGTNRADATTHASDHASSDATTTINHVADHGHDDGPTYSKEGAQKRDGAAPAGPSPASSVWDLIPPPPGGWTALLGDESGTAGMGDEMWSQRGGFTRLARTVDINILVETIVQLGDPARRVRTARAWRRARRHAQAALALSYRRDNPSKVNKPSRGDKSHRGGTDQRREDLEPPRMSHAARGRDRGSSKGTMRPRRAPVSPASRSWSAFTASTFASHCAAPDESWDTSRVEWVGWDAGGPGALRVFCVALLLVRVGDDAGLWRNVGNEKETSETYPLPAVLLLRPLLADEDVRVRLLVAAFLLRALERARRETFAAMMTSAVGAAQQRGDDRLLRNPYFQATLLSHRGGAGSSLGL